MTPTTPVSTIGDRPDPSSAASRTSSWVASIVDRAQAGHPLCAVAVGTPGSGRSALLNAVHEQLRRRDLPVSVGLPAADGAGPVFVLADDMHLWPVAMFETALGMLDAGTIGLIATIEPRELDPNVRRLRDRARPFGAVLELEALGTADVLTRASRAGLTLAPTTASLIRRRCGGARAPIDTVLRALRSTSSSASRVIDEPGADEIAVIDRVSREWHHRLLRGLDPLTLAVLALASVRAPLDPDSVAEAAGTDRAAALEASTGLAGAACYAARTSSSRLRPVHCVMCWETSRSTSYDATRSSSDCVRPSSPPTPRCSRPRLVSTTRGSSTRCWPARSTRPRRGRWSSCRPPIGWSRGVMTSGS
ncbi:hypothetical protein [Gordonia sp. SMJS1]|uniref:hypothetical protein n=1 Tax=Gordonia sp. SMJS1 TaxID=3039400 RepID=UPI0024559610|nr:hypothetical protein [Gordonia sp. SMJS1]WGJ85798.1 hypothetical protein QAD21_00865 [Gordonia sp. SMJS1]